MPGPLTTTARVRELGGIDDAQAYMLFRLASDAALTARVASEIAVASAWLQSRGGADYASGDKVKDTLFAEAEAWLSLQNLYATLRARRLTGTHMPVDQEDSAAFEQLTAVSIPDHIQKFIDQYLVIEEPGKPWAAPAFVTGQLVDRSATGSAKTSRQLLDDIIDEATAISEPGIPRLSNVGDL